jgi:hypothetical protein
MRSNAASRRPTDLRRTSLNGWRCTTSLDTGPALVVPRCALTNNLIEKDKLLGGILQRCRNRDGKNRLH